MKQTANYQLSQWEKSDRIMMEAFNSDNAKLDAALKAEETARIAAVQAEASARAGAVNGRGRISSGSYTGSGGSGASVSCGFRPKLFFVGREAGGEGMALGGPYAGSFGSGFQLYLEGVPSIHTYVGGSTGGNTTYTPNSSGISWTNSCPDADYKSQMAMNQSGARYCWVALG